LNFDVSDDAKAIQRFAQIVASTGTLIHEGQDFPPDWKDVIDSTSAGYARRSNLSPNIKRNQLQQAAALGGRPLTTGARVFNALPNESANRSEVELRRMHLSVSDATQWRESKAKVELIMSKLSFSSKAAKKQEILQELAMERAMSSLLLPTATDPSCTCLVSMESQFRLEICRGCVETPHQTGQ